MSLPRNSERMKNETVMKYCKNQTRPYLILDYASAMGAGASFVSGAFPLGLAFCASSFFFGSIESSKFEKCVKEESTKKTAFKLK